MQTHRLSKQENWWVLIIFVVGPAKSEIANITPVCQWENIQYNIKLILAYCQMLPCRLSVVERYWNLNAFPIASAALAACWPHWHQIKMLGFSGYLEFGWNVKWRNNLRKSSDSHAGEWWTWSWTVSLANLICTFYSTLFKWNKNIILCKHLPKCRLFYPKICPFAIKSKPFLCKFHVFPTKKIPWYYA